MSRRASAAACAAALLLTAPARGGDDATVDVPSAAAPSPNPTGTDQGGGRVDLTPKQLDAMVEGAVSRALARQQPAYPPLPSASASASPQQPYSPAPAYAPPAAPQALIVLQSQTTSSAQVLVPRGPIHAAIGRLGTCLARKGAPKVRTMDLAPVGFAAVPVAQAPSPAVAVYAPALAPQPAPSYAPAPSPQAPGKYPR